MCCFFISLFAFGPRVAFLIYWLLAAPRVNLSFAGFNFPWLVGILGLVFIPWTVLMYVIVFPLSGFDWIWLGLGVFADITAYSASVYKRKQVPGYTGP